MWELTHTEGWVPKNWCFQTVMLEKLLESPLDSRSSNQSTLKEINPEYSLEGQMLKLNHQYFGQLIQRADSLDMSLTNSGTEWRTGKPGVLQSMGLQKSQTWFGNWATTTIPSFQGWCEDEITQGRLLALGLTCCKDSGSNVFIYSSIFRPCQACGSAGKESACNAGDLGSIPELGRSPGEGKGSPLLYSGLENSMDYIVHGVEKSRTQMSSLFT